MADNPLARFFSREAGQQRRRALNALDQRIGDALGHYLGPQLAPRVGQAANALAMFSPGMDVQEAVQASGDMMAPNRTPLDRAASGAALAGALGAMFMPGGVSSIRQGVEDVADAAVRAYDPARMGSNLGNVTRETPAEEVARLLREGKANEVTDELFARADPLELSRLYESGATGMDMPSDTASRMARADEMGLDTDAYHATRATENFDRFRPGWRGSTYFAATPQRAQSGALGGAQDFSQVGGPASTAIIPVRLPGDDVARLRPSRQQWDALPERPFIQDEAELAASVGARYPDDVFETAMSDTGDVISVRRPFPRQQYAADVRNWTGEMLPGWNEGSDAATLERVAQRSGQRGFLVSDEAGASIVAGPDMPIRSRFARFDPRLSHLRNLSAGLAGGAALGAGALAMQPGEAQAMPPEASFLEKYLP